MNRLNEIADLLEQPGAFNGTGGYARRPDGTTTIGTDPEAVCWCFYGAQHKLGIAGRHDSHTPEAEALKAYLGIYNIVDWNDDHTPAEMVAALRAAAQ